MRIAYLDCFSGISGDMFLGALVDAGVSPDLLQETVRALNVGAELQFRRVTRNGIAATKVDVLVGGVPDMPREEFWAESAHHEKHGHTHSHTHEQGHSHGHEHVHGVGDHEHRGLKEIREIITASPISETAKKRALAIFQALGEAEAKVHGTDIASIHFHEVGSVDAIVDIVCAAVGAEALGVDEWRCSALNVGSGTVQCAHGTLPVPAPATTELLKKATIYSLGPNKELVTPTGAAIVKTLVSSFGELPQMTISTTGFGAGTRDFASHANVVRILVGETAQVAVCETSGDLQPVTVIEANIDDMTPQVFAYVLERLLQEGALDAFGTPVQMKKDRPGMLLTALARNEDAQRLADLILAESTTIGLRMRQEQRIVLQRDWVPVETPWGAIRIKLARNKQGVEMNAAPEFEDCRKIAIEHRVPLKNVMQEAMRAYLEQRQDSSLGTQQ